MATRSSKTWQLQVAGLALAILGPPSAAHGQDVEGPRIVPTHNVVLSGYGTVGYLYRPGSEDNRNEFTAQFAPIFLYQFQDKIQFEAELEFELEDGVTETGLEYAQVNYIANDYLVLIGGKFLLPFGVFGERLHPSWINKFATPPPIFGHHESEFGGDPIIPIISDVGVQARGAIRPGPLAIGLSGYITQGPALEDDEAEIPEIGFPASSGDNNSGKSFGGRLDIALPPMFEVNFSLMNGDYDDQNVLDFTAWDVAAEFHHKRLEIRGEYVQTRQEIETFDGFPILKRHGLYAQAAYRIAKWEPVFRWTQIFDSTLSGEVEDEGAWQAAIGLDYWFAPSIALMAGYEINREKGLELDNDRVIVHFAFGF